MEEIHKHFYSKLFSSWMTIETPQLNSDIKVSDVLLGEAEMALKEQWLEKPPYWTKYTEEIHGRQHNYKIIKGRIHMVYEEMENAWQN